MNISLPSYFSEKTDNNTWLANDSNDKKTNDIYDDWLVVPAKTSGSSSRIVKDDVNLVDKWIQLSQTFEWISTPDDKATNCENRLIDESSKIIQNSVEEWLENAIDEDEDFDDCSIEVID
jgi:hypothetical protein